MARKISGYDELIPFYKKGNVEAPNEENGWQVTDGEPVHYKDIWCMVEGVFREQLEAYVGGLTINRNRQRLYMRKRTDLDSTMYFKYQGKMFNIALSGEIKGETQVLGEVAEDGGS